MVGNDTTATSTNLTKFVDSYNEILKLIQQQLQATATTDRGTTLAGDSTLRGLQQAACRGWSPARSAPGTVRALADMGIKTARDGSLSHRFDHLEGAPSPAIRPRSTRCSPTPPPGLGKVTETLVDQLQQLGRRRPGQQAQGDGGHRDAAWTTRSTTLEMRIEMRRQGLIAQFTAMEKIVSNMRSLGNFLPQQSVGS